MIRLYASSLQDIRCKVGFSRFPHVRNPTAQSSVGAWPVLGKHAQRGWTNGSLPWEVGPGWGGVQGPDSGLTRRRSRRKVFSSVLEELRMQTGEGGAETSPKEGLPGGAGLEVRGGKHPTDGGCAVSVLLQQREVSFGLCISASRTQSQPAD